MKAKDIRGFSTEEINGKVRTLRDELFDLNLKKSARQLDQFHKIGQSKKDIARLITVLKEKQAS